MTHTHTTMKTIKTMALLLIIGACQTAAQAQKVYYSMKPGDWSTPATWSYSSSDYQQANEAPGEDDIVYISDADVTISSAVKAAQVVVTHTLLIDGVIPQFGEMSGRGIIQLTGDYYPDVTSDDNYTGMLVVDADGSEVIFSRNPGNYQNLTFNVEDATVKISGNITLSTLRLTKGDLWMMPGAKLTVLNDIEINQDRELAAYGTGTDNKSELIVYGDILNSGKLNLYQPPQQGDPQPYNKSNTDLIFKSDSRDQVLSIVGSAKFNKIKIDKQTTNYYFEILADNTLYIGADIVDLVSGTFVVGPNIHFSELSTSTFKINQNSVLAIAGGEVSNKSDITVEGTLEMRSGNLTCHKGNNGAGLTLSGLSGNITIEGGTVKTDRIVTADNATGAFHMSGGYLEFTNFSSSATFKLLSENTVYELAGGEILFHGSEYSVKSSSPIVTGGKVTLADNNVALNDAVPFFNLTIDKSFVNNASSSPFEVYGDFILTPSASSKFDCGQKDVYIGGDFTIGADATLQGTKDFCFNTDKNTVITDNQGLKFINFVVDKQNSKSVILTSDLKIDQEGSVGILEIVEGTLDAATNGKTILFHGASVINNGSIKGELQLTGTAKTLSGGGTYDIVRQNNSSHVTLGSNITVNDYYFPTDQTNMAYCKLNSYVITINNDYHLSSDKKYFFNNTNMVSSGLRLKIHLPASTQLGDVKVFPIAWGESSDHYAPATIQLVKQLASDVDEYVTFNVVHEKHPCLKNNNNAGVYWVASTSDSKSNKGCFNYHFSSKGAGAKDYYNVALLGITWKQSQGDDYSKMPDANTINFCHADYSMPSGDFTAVGSRDNYRGMDVLYSSVNYTGIDQFNVSDRKWYKKNENGTFDGGRNQPEAGDILVIMGVDYITYDVNFKIGKVIFEPADEHNLGRLLFIETSNKSIGVISGKGNIEVQYDFYHNGEWKLNADYSDFDSNDESVWTAYAGKRTGGNYRDKDKEWIIKLNHVGEFPNLHLASGAPKFISFDGDIKVRDTLNIRNNNGTFRVKGNIDCGNLALGGYNGGTIQFQSGSSYVVNVRRNIGFDYDIPWTGNGSPTDGTRLFTISDGNPTAKKNRLVIGGDIVSTRKSKSNDFGFDLCNSKGDYVILEFAGDTDGKVDVKMSVNKFHFNVAQIVINKDEGKKFTFDDKLINFQTDLSAATSSDGKPLVMKSGVAVFNVAGQVINLSSGNADFVVNTPAKLVANSGVALNVTDCATGITLEGALTLNDGATLTNKGHLYYKETSKAALTLNGNAKFTNRGQFCPDPSSTGKIVLTISQNASVKIGGAACGINTLHGIFDITNGSKIIMDENAEVHFVNGIKNATVPDLTIDAVNSDCSFGNGSKFVFDNSVVSTKVTYTAYRLDMYENKYFHKDNGWQKVKNGYNPNYWDGRLYAPGQFQNSGEGTTFPDNWNLSFVFFPDDLFVDFINNPSSWTQEGSEFSPDRNNRYNVDYYKFNTLVLNGGQCTVNNKKYDTYSYQKRVYTTYSKYVDVKEPSTFTLASSTFLPNVVVTSKATVTLENAITVLEDLAINGENGEDGTLNANGKVMNLKGDFIVDGTFAAQSNTVKFSGSTPQAAKGNKDIVFYNATVINEGGEVTFMNTDIVENELSIGENAVLKDNGNPITVQTKLTNSGTFSYNTAKNGKGIVLNSGSQNHLITVESTGSIGKLYIDNAKNVDCAYTGKDLYINDALTLANGLLNMGKSTLALGKNVAYIDSLGTNYVTKDAEGNVTTINKMVVFLQSDVTNGIKKIFSGNETGIFLMPMGVVGKYAPAIINTNSINADATITIAPRNGTHPTIVEDDEENGYQIVDKDNALTFYWNVVSSGTTNFDGQLIFFNDRNDYHETGKTQYPTVYHYSAARLLATMEKWEKLSNKPKSYTYDKGCISFDGNDVSLDKDEFITGDYTAGICDNDGCGAIPGNLTVYVSQYDGDDGELISWTDKTHWYIAKLENGKVVVNANGKLEKDKDANSSPDYGSVVYIYHNMNYDGLSSGLQLYRTYLVKDKDLTSAGKVNLHVTNGHCFGSISGTGTIVTESGALPRGYYDDFVKPGTGTIEFGGSGDCSIHKSVFNNVVFSGTGKRKLGADDLIVNGNFEVKGESDQLDVVNISGATWNIHGNFVYDKGTFSRPAGHGVSIINMCGSDAQEFSGTGKLDGTNSINILQINNTNYDGVTVNIPIDISQHVEFVHGVLNTKENIRFAIVNTLEDESQTVVNCNTTRFINGPLTKKILTNGSWTFPVGNHHNNQDKESNRLGYFTVYNFYPGNSSGNGFVTVYYHYERHPESENTEMYDDGIAGVDVSEFWTVTPATDGSTFGLKLRWDEINHVENKPAAIANVCITNFDKTKDKWWQRINSAAVATSALTGKVTSISDRLPHDNKSYIYTLAHTNAVTFEWTGDAKTDDWFTTGNWSGRKVPSMDDFVTVGKIDVTTGRMYPVIRGSETAEALFLKIANGASLTIEPEAKMEVFSNVVVDNGGTLLLKAPTQATDFKADAKGVNRGHSIAPAGSLIYNGSFTGLVKFQRFVRGYEWERLCVPLTDYDPTPIATCSSWYLYSYDEGNDLQSGDGYQQKEEEKDGRENSTILASAWQMMNPGTKPGVSDITKQAYRYICSKKAGAHVITLTGKPLADVSTPVVVPVTFNGNDTYIDDKGNESHMLDGWNLIPNPYLSAVDMTKMEFKNVDEVVYVHDNIDNVSFAYQKTAGNVGVVTTGKYNPKYVAAGQSFFVHATAPGSVTFNKNCRDHGNEGILLKSGNTSQNGLEQLVFTTSGNGDAYRSVVYFADDASEGFDSKYDAYMLTSQIADLMMFYSFGSDLNAPLAANCLPLSSKDGGEIQLGYTATSAGTYTLSLNQNTVQGTLVYLYDAQKDTYTELTSGYSCRLTVDAGTDNRRFKLVFRINHAPEVVSPIEDVAVMPGDELEYTIGEVFADNDLYDYVADIEVTSEDGGLLPQWLSFDYETGTFSGTPSYNDMGETIIAVTAEDTHGAKASSVFKITVLNPARPSGSISDINTQSGKFTLEIPDGTFTGFLGTVLTYSYTLADGSPLPSFMSFNPTDGSLSCSTSESQTIQLALTVSDAYNNTLTVNFGIKISIPAPEPVVVEPVTPEPVVPEPVVPEPVVPEPVTPEPVTPEPVVPEPVTPEPVTPEPVVPEPVTPEPVTPEPVTPEPVTPEPVVPEPVTPEPVTPEPVTPEPVTPEPVTPEPVTPEPIVIVPEIVEPVEPEPVVIEPEIVEPVIPEPVIPEPVEPEPVEPEPVTPDPVVVEPVTPKPVIVEPEVVEPSVIEILPEIPQTDPVENVAEENAKGGERVDYNEESSAQFDNLIPENLGGVVVEKDPEVRVYPIPSNGLVTVDLGNLTEETGTVKMMLVAASGRVIAVKDIADSTIELDLTGRPGVYILRLMTPSKTVVKRVVIQ